MNYRKISCCFMVVFVFLLGALNILNSEAWAAPTTAQIVGGHYNIRQTISKINHYSMGGSQPGTCTWRGNNWEDNVSGKISYVTTRDATTAFDRHELCRKQNTSASTVIAFNLNNSCKSCIEDPARYGSNFPLVCYVDNSTVLSSGSFNSFGKLTRESTGD